MAKPDKILQACRVLVDTGATFCRIAICLSERDNKIRYYDKGVAPEIA